METKPNHEQRKGRPETADDVARAAAIAAETLGDPALADKLDDLPPEQIDLRGGEALAPEALHGLGLYLQDSRVLGEDPLGDRGDEGADQPAGKSQPEADDGVDAGEEILDRRADRRHHDEIRIYYGRTWSSKIRNI